MIDILEKLVCQLNSSVFVLLCILGLSYWGVFRISALIKDFSFHKVKVDKIDSISDSLIELKTQVQLIYLNTHPQKMVAPGSPLSLTPRGKEMAEKIHAHDILEKNLEKLIKLVEKSSPKNAYDIQTSSMEIVKTNMASFLNEEELNLIKSEAYNKGVLTDDIMLIFGILLRNKILEEKSLPISDVDKHAKHK